MKTTLLFCLIWLAIPALAQRTIKLTNPSFEGDPIVSEAPYGWIDCGFLDESPPDVQPGGFHVTDPAYDGETYLGLVVRDNSTWEAVGQELSEPLLRGKLYELRLYLACAPYYISLSRVSSEEVNYNEPIILRVWGSNEKCGDDELLAETQEITDKRWHKYRLKLKPMQLDKCRFLKLEAFYKNFWTLPYNGNLILDNCSLIELN